jgi:glycosyltransferase involved in cell wall biosynthesis
MVDFTVVIPTYNGEKRLPQLLERLREAGRSHSVKSQTNTEQFSWEILVVDNNSKDNTAKVVQEYQANWPDTYPLRYSFEAEQGAAFARQRAIKEARGELIGFLDDDNCLTLSGLQPLMPSVKRIPKLVPMAVKFTVILKSTHQKTSNESNHF